MPTDAEIAAANRKRAADQAASAQNNDAFFADVKPLAKDSAQVVEYLWAEGRDLNGRHIEPASLQSRRDALNASFGVDQPPALPGGGYNTRPNVDAEADRIWTELQANARNFFHRHAAHDLIAERLKLAHSLLFSPTDEQGVSGIDRFAYSVLVDGFIVEEKARTSSSGAFVGEADMAYPTLAGLLKSKRDAIANSSGTPDAGASGREPSDTPSATGGGKAS